VLSYLLGVVVFAVGIGATIGLHEFGHMRTAVGCGMKVRRFYVGFGPTLLKWRGKTSGTEYGFKLFPLGGFCDIAGMVPEEELTPAEQRVAMYRKPWWQQVWVLSGGVLMNLVLGTLIIYLVAVFAGLPNPDADYSARVGQVQCVDVDAGESACPAKDAGLTPGDVIVAVDGSETPTFADVRQALMQRPGQEVALQVDRGGEILDVDVAVASVQRETTDGRRVDVGVIGVTSAPVVDAVKRYGPVEAVPRTGVMAWDMMGATFKGLAAFPAKLPGVAKSIVGGEREQESPMSVVGASRIGGELAERAQWSIFAMMLASLNFFLAVFNLVPLPPLDGGRIAVVLYQAIRDWARRVRGLAPLGPVDYRKVMPVTIAAASVLIAVGVLTIVADVVNPIRLFG